MMEFITSHWAMFLCGAALLSAVVVPLSGVLADDAESGAQDCADGAAELMEEFWGSGLDEMYLSGDSVLPGPGWTARFEYNTVTVTSPDEESYTGYMKHMCQTFELQYGQEKTIFRDGDRFGVRRRCPPLC
jgi:hypothetical protein